MVWWRRQAEEPNDDLTRPLGVQDHLLGPANPLVTLLEYGDYECPNCRRAFPMIQELQKRLPRTLRFAFRHFPLVAVHPHAARAAEAAEAAGAQDHFWAMHAHLFANQQALDDAALRRYAADLGLDVARFARALAEGTHRAKVEADHQSGLESGVTGTPTFFINGRRYTGSADYDSLLYTLQHAAKQHHEREG